MGAKAEGLGGFLRARRNELQLADADAVETGGVGGSSRRRVPGLRREEVAHLAGVSTDYLVRLEQGRDLRPSSQVLDALATALRLNESERGYLHLLANASDPPACGRPGPSQQVGVHGRRLLDAVPDAPTLIVGRNLDVLDQNLAAVGVFGCLRGKNLLRSMVFDARVRGLHLNWEQTTSEMIGILRERILDGGADAELCRLIPDLSSDPIFTRLWTTHRAPQSDTGTARLNHPDNGDVTYDYQLLRLPDPAQWALLYTIQPDAIRDTRTHGTGRNARSPQLTSPR